MCISIQGAVQPLGPNGQLFPLPPDTGKIFIICMLRLFKLPNVGRKSLYIFYKAIFSFPGICNAHISVGNITIAFVRWVG
ncbi:hypothetical protein ES288_D10G131600v1 [Gossypium darwinii]|uniref:Uncharacterized protein n=1 Tax=Gossypium darwinii TaxID=34276 RepID=A0A5D2B1D3_GOSDA|nr:hypothetical protein ES288_D10G131600v1 [Gossypium darwinii]